MGIPAQIAVPEPRERVAIGGLVSPLAIVLTYYWVHLYARVLMPEPDESPLSYGVTVLAVSVAAIGALCHAVLRGVRPRLSRTTVALMLFVAAATVASVPRGDLATIRSAVLLVMTLIWLDTGRGTLSLRMLNGFFIASIMGGALWYALGLSEYGLLPGQYSEGADRGIEWRISLFPFVPESGFFALVVCLANQLKGRGRPRILMCALSLYFLVFSGMRSAMLALLLCEAYVFMSAFRRRRTWRATQLMLLVTVFILSIVFSNLALLIPSLTEGVLGNYLFRTESMGDSEAGLSQTVYRGWLWLQHLGLFLSSPLTGIGTFDFSAVISEELIEGADGTGSESFITSWLARLGLCFAPFLIYLVLICRRAAAVGSSLPGTLFIVLGVAGFAYGSFLVPYNFMFLILFRLLLQSDAPAEPSPVPRPGSSELERL